MNDKISHVGRAVGVFCLIILFFGGMMVGPVWLKAILALGSLGTIIGIFAWEVTK